MPAHFDHVEFVCKDPGSGQDGCPAFYRVAGGAIAQGRTIDDETRAQLRQLADDEDGVFLPDALIELFKSL